MEFTAESFVNACREGGRKIEIWLRSFDRQYGASLYREAAMALGSWHAAQDVVQDGMIKVWQRCATFRGPAHPIAWIRTIVRNTLLDHLDKRKPEAPLWDETGDFTPEAASAVAKLSAEQVATPEQTLQSGELERVYRHCFDRFQQDCPKHAQVLRWVVEEGLSNNEIEELLGRTPGATREFISQCRKRARPYFAPWYALIKQEAQGAASEAEEP